MPIFELAALSAATLWALTALISSTPSQKLGALAFNKIRMLMVFGMLAIYATSADGWGTINAADIPILVLSGLIGIFCGDTALYLTLNRVGPRLTGILFALSAPIATLLGWVFLQEALNGYALGGIGLVSVGVICAILFGKRDDQTHRWEQLNGPLWVGICLGLIAASCQAIGSLIVRPMMVSGVDPIAASAVRVGVAALCLSILSWLPIQSIKMTNQPDTRDLSLIAISGFLGMGVGMTLILFALSGGEVGIISALSATTPAIILPILWWQTGERPALGAWIGAALVVIGTSAIFLR